MDTDATWKKSAYQGWVYGYGLRYVRLSENWREEIDKYIQSKEDKANAEEAQPPPVDDVDDDDIPPRQIGLWNNEEE